MPVPVLPVPVLVPLPPPPPVLPPAPPVAPPSTRRSAFSHSHPHHPALVIPPAALRADLTTDDPTPPPLAPGQIIPLALAPTHVPLPPSPVDSNSRPDEPEIKTNRHTPTPMPLPQPREVDSLSRGAPQLLSSTATAKTSKEVLEAIEEAASSALPIPIPISILPPSATAAVVAAAVDDSPTWSSADCTPPTAHKRRRSLQPSERERE
jgi:hypothetical protein